MARKKIKHEIISYTYKVGEKIHTATVAHQDKTLDKAWDQSLLPNSSDANSGCQCGQTKCVDKHLWRCMDIDGEGTCVWFITNEQC